MNRPDRDKTQSVTKAFVVTPNDSVDLPRDANALYIGGVGTVRILHINDTIPVDYPVTVAGTIYPWTARRVYATGTTATNILAQITAP